MGFGFGAGSGKGKHSSGPDEGEGGGGGGGGGAVPLGVVEISPEGTRFIGFRNRKKMLAALAAGMAIGVALGRRR